MELPHEWRDKTLFDIESVVSTPLTINASTKNRVFGYCAHILVDMNISKRLFYDHDGKGRLRI